MEKKMVNKLTKSAVSGAKSFLGGIWDSVKYLFWIAFILSFPVTGWFYFSDPEPTVETVIPNHGKAFYVNDFGGYLSRDTEDYIMQQGPLLWSATGAQVTVVVVPNTGSLSLESYANKLFNKWGIGQVKKNNGVLILFTADEPHVRMEVGKGLEGNLNDAKAGRILDRYAVAPMKAKNWNAAVVETWRATMAEVYRIYGKEPPVGITDYHLPVERGELGNQYADLSFPATIVHEPEPEGPKDGLTILAELLGTYIGYWIMALVILIPIAIFLTIGSFGGGFSGGRRSSSGGGSWGGYSGGGGSSGGGGASR